MNSLTEFEHLSEFLGEQPCPGPLTPYSEENVTTGNTTTQQTRHQDTVHRTPTFDCRARSRSNSLRLRQRLRPNTNNNQQPQRTVARLERTRPAGLARP